MRALGDGGPAVLEGSAAVHWEAMSWSQPGLAAGRPGSVALKHVSIQPANRPLFYNYDPGAVLAEHAPQDVGSDTVTLPLSQLLRPSPGGTRKYWAGPIDDAELGGAVGPAAAVRPVDVQAGDRECQSHRLWLGSGGLVAALHYDTYHNALVQLVGAKRVVLLPPSQLGEVGLYPALHPRYRQAHESAAATTKLGGREKQARTYGPEAMEALLRPGDVLYIPPFWLHEIESIAADFTASVNIWCPDPVLDKAEDIFSLPIPVDHEAAPDVRLFHVVEYLRMLPGAVLSHERGGAVRDWSSGHRHFFGQFISRRLPAQMIDRAKPFDRRLVERGYKCGMQLAAEHAPDRLRLAAAAARISAVLDKVEPIDVRITYLEDLIEEIIAFFVDPVYVFWFAEHCLV